MGTDRDHRVRRLGRGGRWGLALLLAAALLVGLAPTAPTLAAPSCVVTSAADSGAGTLRQCLADVDSGGTITFTLPNPSTITLTSSFLAIGKSLTITGPGAAALTVSGNDIRKVFIISTGTVAISGLTIAHAKANDLGGGVLLNGGDLTVTGVAFVNNVAEGGGGGLFTTYGTTATVNNSSFTGNSASSGGGIFVQGTATLTDSTISGNAATEFDGGGVMVLGTATITNSVISGNTATTSGGGLQVYKPGSSSVITGATLSGSTVSGNTAAYGGGIQAQNQSHAGASNVTVINSTISGNNATVDGGGLYVTNVTADGSTSVVLQAVTVTNNVANSDNSGGGAGGGIRREAFGNPVVQVQGSIVAGNRQGAGTANDCSGTLTAQGGTLWGDQTACPSGGVGDRDLATLGMTIGQVLNPLADNGGPTLTHALVAGSPAIDLVPNASCAPAAGVDQRGTARPQGAACDAGAYETTAAAPCISGFADVPSSHPACAAIAALTSQNIIRGYATNPPTFGVADPVQRAQVAAFLVRALQWQNEATGPKTFTDFGALVAELQTASLVLANKCDMQGSCVGKGYDPAGCTARGKVAPCFGPTDSVSYAQVISFVARAFQFDETYAWQPQPGGALPYTGIPTVHENDARTYHHYAGTIPLAPTTAEGWNQPAPRAWVAMVLYQALQTTP